MLRFLTSFKRMDFILIFILLISTIQLSQAKTSENFDSTDLSANSDDTDDNSSAMEEQQRPNDLRNKLKYFLLTSNAEQRAAKRKHQDSLKQELIREYLQAVSDQDSNRLQELKKRFITYCNSYEDLIRSNYAACG